MLENRPTFFEESHHNDTLGEGEQPRRLACNRCRRQKLRCSRDRIDSESCNRCLRANLNCTDRPPLPMGRPNKRLVPEELGQRCNGSRKRQQLGSTEARGPSSIIETDDELRKHHETEPRSDNQEPVATDTSIAQSVSPSAWSKLSNLPFPSPGHTPPSTSPVIVNVTTPANLANFPDDSDIPQSLTLPDDFDFNNLMPPDDVEGFDFSLSWGSISGWTNSPITSLNPSRCSLPTGVPMAKSQTAHMDGSMQLNSEWNISQTIQLEQCPAPHNHQRLSPPENTDFREDRMQKLWILNLSMCKQLQQQINSMLQKDATLSIQASEASGNSETRPDNTCSVGDILTSSENFLEILRSFLPTSDSTSDASPSSLISSSRHFSKLPANNNEWGAHETACRQNSFSAKAQATVIPQLDTPTILLILTCHIRLIRLYNNLFSRIHSSLLALPSMNLEPLPIVQDLQMGGFQLQRYGGLQILILLQVCTHLLHLIENALGLPDEYMISSREGSGGVLRNLASMKLIESAWRRRSRKIVVMLEAE